MQKQMFAAVFEGEGKFVSYNAGFCSYSSKAYVYRMPIPAIMPLLGVMTLPVITG